MRLPRWWGIALALAFVVACALLPIVLFADGS